VEDLRASDLHLKEINQRFGGRFCSISERVIGHARSNPQPRIIFLSPDGLLIHAFHLGHGSWQVAGDAQMEHLFDHKLWIVPATSPGPVVRPADQNAYRLGGIALISSSIAVRKESGSHGTSWFSRGTVIKQLAVS